MICKRKYRMVGGQGPDTEAAKLLIDGPLHNLKQRLRPHANTDTSVTVFVGHRRALFPRKRTAGDTGL